LINDPPLPPSLPIYARRLYGVGGVETDVFCAPGVVLAAAGSGPRLILAYHLACPVTGDPTPQVCPPRTRTRAYMHVDARTRMSVHLHHSISYRLNLYLPSSWRQSVQNLTHKPNR
jgi:hypothetical protein